MYITQILLSVIFSIAAGKTFAMANKLNDMGVTTSSVGIPLHDIYEDKFLIGSVLSGGLHAHLPPYRQDEKELKILAREFNSLTSENNMKMQYIQPAEGKFYFGGSDAAIDFAEEHDMDYVGHALVWHHQVPDWLFKHADGSEVDRDTLIDRMHTHIHTVVSRYKGRIKYWDVVNEAIDTKIVNGVQIAFLRESPWLRIIGPEYIEMAFRAAHEADPSALLLYNDFSMFEPAKIKYTAELFEELMTKGMPIHGIGFQGHWHLKYPKISEVESAIERIGALGLKVSISELEVGILPLADDYQGAEIDRNIALDGRLNPYADGAPDSILQQQARRYSEIFELFLRKSDSIERVTFWGTLDQYSWQNNWPIEGRTAWPLLFDRDYQAKPAYHAISGLIRWK
ncbi:MAG: endo-1,4-beta-xylanase [Verrucomicrobiota bacterium]|nr:endo-1,4-beta-xylanase [Verrucomicrobiota bacterium]